VYLLVYGLFIYLDDASAITFQEPEAREALIYIQLRAELHLEAYLLSNFLRHVNGNSGIRLLRL